MSLAQGNSTTSTTTTATIARSSRDRNSIRCEMKVSCGASGVGSLTIAPYGRSKPGSDAWRGKSAGAAARCGVAVGDSTATEGAPGGSASGAAGGEGGGCGAGG